MSAFSPVQTRRTFEEAVEQIAERISIGELAPGDQLPPERTLAQQMEISRWGPTRRAPPRLGMGGGASGRQYGDVMHDPPPPKPLPDVGGPGLRLLLCGINPSLRSAATGHHFARPGNRFWPALHLAGITPRRFAPIEQHELRSLGVGITNVCARPTRRADELMTGELLAGALALEALVAGWRPEVVAIVGVTAYRAAFSRPRAALGEQPERLGGRPLWVLPNPSGLNAHHRVEDLARWYGAAWAAAGGTQDPPQRRNAS